MMNRASGPPPAWEYAITTVLILGSVWFAFKAADAATRDSAAAGLRAAGAAVEPIENGFEARDPWGTRVRVVT